MQRRSFLGVAAGASVVLSAARRSQAQSSETDRRRHRIACSTTQVADFARQIVGDRMEVDCILAPGEDPHLRELKPGDARIVAQASLCAENGWHLEGKEWMRTLAENARKPLVTCADGCEPLQLEEDGEQIRDPHAWFSCRNAATFVRNLFHGIADLDPQHAHEYESRAELYLSHLRVLHRWIGRQTNQLPVARRVLVTSHDAFNYFCRDYGFRSAAPAGWSTGSEVGGGVTPERRRETVESIRQFGVPAIFVETSVNRARIEQIAEDAQVKIGGELYSDSMGPPGTAGETYLGMMRENVVTIVGSLK